MPLERVTGVVWWKMGISHYKALFRRATTGEASAGYTKDYLQAPRAIGQVLQEMFRGRPPYEPLVYRWPGGSFGGGRIYPASDFYENGRLEVGQWTESGAPHPWRIGDPATDPLITLPGNPRAPIPDAANRQWTTLERLQPWLVMVQLDNHQHELHLRAYLARPTADLVECDIANVPDSLRTHMHGRGGLARRLPALWFDPDDLRTPWSERAAPPRAPTTPPARPRDGRTATNESEYVRANENARSSTPEPFTVDPDLVDRATRAHAVTQNAVADVVEANGFAPLTPSSEPFYDVGWVQGDAFVVCEVKSLTPGNEERQLRLGIGQVLRYRHLLMSRHDHVLAVLVTSSEPSDRRWMDLCVEVGIALMWLPSLPQQLSRWIELAPHR